MTAMPWRCAQCDSPWPADRDACWACGSTARVDNPDLVNPPPVARPYRPTAAPATIVPAQVSQTPYVIVTVITTLVVGLGVWWLLHGVVAHAFGYGVIAGGLTGANAWIVSLISITKARVDRNGRLLDDLARRLPGG